MQPSEQASVRPLPRVQSQPSKPPKLTAARNADRRVEMRQERLVSAWLRSLATR